MDDKKPDEKLIRAYRTGNNRAFEILLKRYEKPLFAFIFRFVGDKQTAEDLFQQVWLKILGGFDSYVEKGKFGSWLFGVAHNCCIDYLRSANVSLRNDLSYEEGFDHFASETATPDEIIIQDEERLWLEKAIGELPEDQKEVLLLRLYSNMTFKEIAKQLNCPLNTVLGRMHYAVAHLKKMSAAVFRER